MRQIPKLPSQRILCGCDVYDVSPQQFKFFLDVGGGVPPLGCHRCSPLKPAGPFAPGDAPRFSRARSEKTGRGGHSLQAHNLHLIASPLTIKRAAGPRQAVYVTPQNIGEIIGGRNTAGGAGARHRFRPKA